MREEYMCQQALSYVRENTPETYLESMVTFENTKKNY